MEKQDNQNQAFNFSHIAALEFVFRIGKKKKGSDNLLLNTYCIKTTLKHDIKTY